MKKQISTVDATPSKRLYLSIIADYDLNKGICELIDNSLELVLKVMIDVVPSVSPSNGS